MYASDEKMDPLLEEKLVLLTTVPPRDPQAAALGRANYLLQAQSMAQEGNLSQAVSETQTGRHKGWIENLSNLFRRKEGSPMFATLVSIFVVISLFLGGTGATVYASQGSLPDQPLYEVKTFSEDLRLGLAGGEQDQLELYLEFAGRRIQEFNRMFQRGAAPSEAVLARYRQQMDGALILACDFDDPQLTRILQRIRLNLHTQEQALERLQAHPGPQVEAVLARAQDMVRTRLHWVEDGLRDPQGFRKQIRGRQPGQEIPGGPNASPDPGIDSGSSYGPGPDASKTPGSGNSYGPGPYVTGTPAPGSGYGPGPNTSQNPGSSEPSGGSYGPGPGPSDEPESGTGQEGSYGPGPDDCQGSCTGEPAGESVGPGPGPSDEPESGMGQDGGNGPGPGPGDSQPPGSEDSGESSGAGPDDAADSSCTSDCGTGPNPPQDPDHHEEGNGEGHDRGHNKP